MKQGNLAVLAMTERSSSADRQSIPVNIRTFNIPAVLNSTIFSYLKKKKKTLDYIFYGRFGLLGFKQPWLPF